MLLCGETLRTNSSFSILLALVGIDQHEALERRTSGSMETLQPLCRQFDAGKRVAGSSAEIVNLKMNGQRGVP